MEITVTGGDVTSEASELAIVLRAIDEALPDAIWRRFRAGDFEGKPNQTIVAYPAGVVSRVVLVGLGDACGGHDRRRCARRRPPAFERLAGSALRR